MYYSCVRQYYDKISGNHDITRCINLYVDDVMQSIFARIESLCIGTELYYSLKKKTKYDLFFPEQ